MLFEFPRRTLANRRPRSSLRRVALAVLAGAVCALPACGGQLSAGPGDAGKSDAAGSSSGSGGSGGASSGGSGGSSGSSGSSGGSSGGSIDAGMPVVPYSSKVDLLFMIDNSVSMGDKQNLLALAAPNIVQRLVQPNCIDAGGHVVGPSGPSGACASGHAEFTPVHDLHIGILSSSLGSRGGDVCPDATTNPANPALNAHNNDHGELLNRTGVFGDPTVENTIGDAPAPLDFLSYFPAVAANAGQPAPPTPAVTTPGALISDFSALVEGVHEHGCGFEAQNEAWYRFLVQPDPFATETETNDVATFSGVDATILKRRADFLRPDSIVAVIVLTDENEEAVDPLTVKGQGWAFNQSSFPGSKSGGGAPEGIQACQSLDPNNPTTTGPNDPTCTSCAFLNPADPSFATQCPKDGANGNAGYLDPANDSPNLRYFHQKMRFGLSSAYPTSRYVRGLQRSTVPSVGLAFQGDTDHEHDANGNYVGDQDANANCVNPLFAAGLPTTPGADLCHLKPGPRTPNLVYYATIAGVPHELLQAKPGDTSPGSTDASGNALCPAGTPPEQCPQKATLSAADWTLMGGRDPEHYDFRGSDFHMIESIGPRTTNAGQWANAATCTPQAGVTPPLPGAAGADPINGCEFSTNNSDLQFACVFPLVTVDGSGVIQPFVKDCTDSKYGGACDCSPNSLDNHSQLCFTATPTHQVYAKAYPSLREVQIAKAMSQQTIGGKPYDQGIVSSLCPIALDVGETLQQAQNDPLFGYNPAVNAIIDRIKVSISK